MVNANRDVIRFAHQALRLPYQQTNTDTSIDDRSPPYDNLRHLTWLLTLAGDVAWESDNQSEAIDCYLDAVTIGRKIPNRVGIIGHLVGLSCETIGRSHLWERLGNMNADTAQQCLTRLNRMATERIPLSVAYEEEKYTAQSIVAETTADPKPASYAGLVPKRIIMNTLTDYMDKQIALTKQPYAAGNEEIPCPKELLTGMLAPVTRGTRCKYTAVETGDVLLRTALALRLYRLKTGKPPDQLTELVAAGLLTRIPDDPFSPPGTRLQFKVLPSSETLLYSVGPDGIDDNGGYVEGKMKSSKVIRQVDPDSKGDMIAGWGAY